MAGRGGGASVALLIAGMGATVSVEHTALHAGSGGDGSAGGAGGDPGPGAEGAPGSTTACDSKCVSVGDLIACQCQTSSSKMLSGGAAGQPGGDGGAGAHGGGGSGGPSYGVVLALGGKVQLDDASKAMLVFATGGKGAGMAPSGGAATTFTQPML
jgi:hypothetical protein